MRTLNLRFVNVRYMMRYVISSIDTFVKFDAALHFSDKSPLECGLDEGPVSQNGRCTEGDGLSKRRSHHHKGHFPKKARSELS